VDSSRSGPHRSVKPVRVSPERLKFLQLFCLLIFLTLLFQLLQLTIFYRAPLLRRAEGQHRLTIEIPPLRGQILDRNGQGLAINLKVPSIYAIPRILKEEEKETLSQDVAEALSLSRTFVTERLARDKAFVWLKRRVTTEEQQKIEMLNHPALGILYEYKRFYPHGTLLANLLGFTNVDSQGIEGIEKMLDSELRGRPGKRFTRRDALGREIKAFEERMIPALDGHRTVLTIDRYLQYVTERALTRAYQKWKAKGAIAVLMNPQTGEILAMATRPTFDPNSPGDSPFENYRNRVLTDMFEPGSVFKIVTAAAVLSERKITMTQKIHCENGEWSWGLRTLHDVHGYGPLSFPEIFIKSSNIGTVKLALRLGPGKLHHYVKLFGFGKKTGIDLQGEAPGYVRPPSQWSKTSPYAVPIGQEVMVTPLQLARAISFVANGGRLVKPYVVERVEDIHGVTLRETEPILESPKLEPAVVEALKETLWRATEEGTGKNARVKGIPVAGKTGTAQKILEGRKGYSHSNFVGSFIGFAPADHPLFSMIVMIDDPKGAYYGGTVAAPVFSEVMEAALAHVGYAP
jgi:cell division protein FtsI (penicillin-binding protein 3)